MRARFFFAVFAVSAAAYACGGVDSDLIGGASDGGDDDAAGGKRDAGSRDASVSEGDSGRAGDSGIVTQDSGVKDSGVRDSGVHDGGIIVHPSDGGVVPVTCGNQADAAIVTCTASAPTCCADQELTGTDFSCTTSPAICTGTNFAAVQCRDDRDCPGTKVCCGAIPSVYTSVKCLDACPTQDDAGNPFYRFCTPGQTDSECIEYGTTCVPSSLLPGFNHC